MRKKNIILELRSFLDDTEVAHMVSKGRFWEKEGKNYIEWDTSANRDHVRKEIISINGNKEISFFEGNDMESIALVLQKGKRCITQSIDDQFFAYAPIGYSLNYIHNALTPKGGDLNFSYTTDSYAAKNVNKTIYIKVSLDKSV